jgi:putative restriction endonuclease
MLHIQSPRLASEQLVEGQPYTRTELRQLFDTTDTSIETTVFRPSGYDSVWLFITRETASDPQYQSQLVDTMLKQALAISGASSIKAIQVSVRPYLP